MSSSNDKDKDKDKDIVKSEKFNDLGAFANSLAERYSDPKKQCKLCNSKWREEAESMFEKGRAATQIHRWLVDDKKEDISYGAVNNHLTQHFKTDKDNLSLKEFATQLGKWSELSSDTEALMNRYIKTFDREATLLLARNNELPVFEVRKNIETAMKAAQLIGYYKEQLQKLQAEKRPVELVIMSLNRIIQVKLEGSSSPEVKRVLTDIVDQLSREIGEISVDGETLEN
jgi:hypothetical protein